MANVIPPGAANALGVGTGSWEARLKEAAYTPPSGPRNRIRFAYEDVSRETEKRTAAFSFPGVDEEYIQDNGHGSRQYPLRCFFSGSDCDLLATAFELALLERGRGKLEHPLYGTFDVVPFGKIVRRDDLKRAANQAVVEVTFWKTLGAVFPQTHLVPENELAAALAGFDVAAAQQFADSMDLDTAVRRASAKAAIRNMLLGVDSALGAVSKATSAVNQEFRDIQSLVNLGIDTFIGQPLELARQISNLIKAPGRALAGIRSRLDGYRNLFDDIFGSKAARPWEAFESGDTIVPRFRRIANDFHVADLFASNAVAGTATSILHHRFQTRPQAIRAADEILDLFDDAVAWRDQGFEALAREGRDIANLDTGESYQALQRAVALAAGFLVEISFSLVPERVIVLDRPRSIIDLSAELYGSVDDRIDFLIESNNLTGSEILELPRGSHIVYYPDPS